MFLVPILTMMAIEDFRYRGINWFWFPALGICILFSGFPDIQGSLLNFLFLGIQFIGLTIYFSIKEMQPVNIIDRYIGLGDVLFLLLLSLLFSPVNLLVFFTSSLLLWLVIYLLINNASSSPDKSIPLVGCLAINLLPLILLSSFWDIRLNDDQLLLSLLIY